MERRPEPAPAPAERRRTIFFRAGGERVVILVGGRVRGVGTVEEMCARRANRFKLRIQGDPSAFRAELEAAGATVTAEDGRAELAVAVPDRWDTVALFAAAACTGIALRSLTRDDETLEERFLKTVR